jgi:two-component sensor histidine kinase
VVQVLTIGLLKQGKEQEALAFLHDLLRKDLPYSITEKRNILSSIARCYAKTKQYPLAEKYWLKALALSQQEGAMHSRYNAIGSLSSFYVTTGQYRKAIPYLKQLLAAPKGIIPLSNVAETELDCFKVDSAAGNYLSAIAHFRRHKALTDAIFTAAKTQQLQQLQVTYETGQKEQRIQLLTAKGLQQQSELKRTQTARNGILGGAALLSLLLGVSYNRYRAKRRSTALLEIKQREINQQNHALAAVLVEKDGLLEEKEWMLKEIHHRVKNNLQIISSLLNRQSHYLHDAPALAAIRESQNRVQAMALIHQKLYQTDNLARVNMQDYTQEILARLVDSFDRRTTVGQQVQAAGMNLEVALATPVGLIINEAVTNTLKHAFPDSHAGTIAVGLRQLADGRYELTVADDGIGLPLGFDVQASGSLGLTIIQGLSKQLHGQLTIEGTGGVYLRLLFAAERLAHAPKTG